MRLKSKAFKLAPIPLFLVALGISSFNAFAAQTETLVLTPISPESTIADQVSGSGSYSYIEPISPSQTPITPENEGHWYGWSFNVASMLPCPSAVLQNVHIRSSNALETEGNPDWSVMLLASVENGIANPVTPQRPVVEGYSPDAAPFYVGRWSLGAEQFPPATAEWGIGIAGPMEAVWDASGLDINNDLVLAVGHDAEDGTTGLQTTVESVEVTFDDSPCNPDVPPVNVSPTPSSPKTGSIASVIVAASAAIAAVLLTLKTAKKLKAKH